MTLAVLGAVLDGDRPVIALFHHRPAGPIALIVAPDETSTQPVADSDGVGASRESLPMQTVALDVPVGSQLTASVPPAPAFGIAFAAAVAVAISSLPPLR